MTRMRKIRVIVLQDINYFKGVSIHHLYAHQCCKCFYCQRFMEPFPYKKNVWSYGFTKDHLFPNSLGFTLSGNTVLACRGCNHRKENRMPSHKEIRRAMKLYNTMKLPFVCNLTWKKYA